MLQDMFSNWCTGRIGPRRFAVLWSILVVALVAITFLLFAGAITAVAVLKVGSAELERHIWAAVVMVGGILLFLAALFNITIKRGRDIGIPGFVTGVGFLVLFTMGGLTVFLTIALALVPSGTVSRSHAS